LPSSTLQKFAGRSSTRTEAARVPFYRPRLLRSPYLYVATAETRKSQDQFEDFLGMPFSRRFEPSGFRRSALLPCYGLAEDTLCVTSRRPGEGPRFEAISRAALEQEDAARPEPGGVTVASVGRALPDHEISVVDRQGRPLGDRRVGEIIIRGASVMRGYLPGTEGDVVRSADGALATGDLGYLANLCHGCQGCFHACQYAPPHPWGINVPQAFAALRVLDVPRDLPDAALEEMRAESDFRAVELG
jgi:hypothetical protein